MINTTKRSSFRADARGGVLIVFALVILPVLGLAGLALDYGVARVNAARLQVCVDAAVLAGAAAARDVVSSPTGTKSAAEAAAMAASDKYVKVSCAPASTVKTSAISSTFKIAFGAMEANISYRGSSKSFLSVLFGVSTLPITVTTQSQVSLPTFLSAYFVIDNSQSMGFASTQAGRDKLRALTTRYAADPGDANCTFACHRIEKSNKSFYDLARDNRIELRIDTLQVAVLDVIKQAKAAQTLDGQYKFDVTVFAREPTNILPLSGDFKVIESALNTKVQLSVVDNMGATYPELALNALAARLPNSGDGITASSPKIMVILATDGVADETALNSFYKRNIDRPSRSPALIAGACDEFVRRNAKIAVIETTFTKVPGNGAYDNHIAPWYDQISPALARCASSPDLYFRADVSTEILKAFQTLFDGHIQPLRLTK